MPAIMMDGAGDAAASTGAGPTLPLPEEMGRYDDEELNEDEDGEMMRPATCDHPPPFPLTDGELDWSSEEEEEEQEEEEEETQETRERSRSPFPWRNRGSGRGRGRGRG
jgi:hypothetical protein